MKKIIPLCLFITLMACASSQTAISKKLNSGISKNTAKVVLQRDRQFVRALATARIRTRGKTIATISNGGTEFAFIKPGKHVLTVDNWGSFGKSNFLFNALEGKTYKFLIQARDINVIPGALVISAPSKSDAKGNISGGLFRNKLISVR